jgi:hypothetical protein
MYLFLSLALLWCCVDVTWGRIQKKDPQESALGIESPKAGMMLAFNRCAFSAQGEETNRWLYAGENGEGVPSLMLSEASVEPSRDNMAWILETSTVVIKEGYQSFYLKNYSTGEYLKCNIGSGTDEGESNLYMGEKSEATSFIIVPTKEGAPILGVTMTDFEGKGGVLKDGDWMLISIIGENFQALNTAGAQGFMAEYADYAAWHTVYEVEPYNSTFADLQDALADMPQLAIKGGTNPGCYPQALVDEYNAAWNAVYALTQQVEEPAKDVTDAAIERLRKADAAIKAAKHNPLVTGFFRIVSANTQFEQTQGKRYDMTAINGVPAWREFGTTANAEIWHITALGGNKVTIQNVDNTLYLVGPETGGASTAINAMSKEPTGEMTITFFDNASSARIKYNGGLDFHANNHGGGAGTGSNIVLWDGEAGNASSWFIEAVSGEELAQIEAIFQQSKITAEFNELLATATEKYNIAAVYNKTGNGLITAVDQLSSNADHNAINANPDGQGLAGLIDGDIHTFFHSLWIGGAEGAPDAYHNLTVDLKTTLNKFAFTITPRKYTPGANYATDPSDCGTQSYLNNRPTEIVLYGAKADADPAQAESWKKLQTITGLPNSNVVPANDEELPFTTPGYILTSDYQYLRFEVIKTNNNAGITVNGHQYPYFTMAEFQLYNVELDPTCQLAKLGAVGTAFEEAYKKALDVETPTQQDIDDLKAALQAFMEGGLADPTELKAVIDEAEAFIGGIIEVVEEDDVQPGKYPAGTQATLEGALEVANTYYALEAEYTPEGLKEETANLRAALDAAKASLFTYNTNTWYRLRFCQTFYEANGVPELQPENRTGEAYTVAGPDEGVEGGAILYGVQADQENDQFLWRFVAVDEEKGTYALQNKATKMFIGGPVRSNYTQTTVNPIIFTIESLGYAAFQLSGTELDGEPAFTNGRVILHAQTDGKMVVFWSGKGLPVLNADKTQVTTDNGCCWEFIPEDEYYDDEQSVSTLVAKGQLQTACYPFATTISGEGLTAYSIAGVDDNNLYLKEEGTDFVELAAGQPILYTLTDDVTTPNEYTKPETMTKNDSTHVTVIINTEFVTAPSTVNGLIGHFLAQRQVSKGNGVVGLSTAGKNVINPLKSDASIGANKAYINKYQVAGTTGDIAIPITGDLNVGIQNAIAEKMNSMVDVYTIDGIRVRQGVKYGKATEGLQKGLYIINKKVVAVD